MTIAAAQKRFAQMDSVGQRRMAELNKGKLNKDNVRDGLEVGDNAAAEDAATGAGQAIDNLADVVGDTARNFGLFLLFAALVILGLWALARQA